MSAIEIPHDVQPHPITGMYNGKFGLWLFLASEVMLFGALFSTYVLLRVGAPDDGPLKWPHHTESGLNVPLATVNTAVLITSSVTVVMAWYFLQLRKFGAARLCIAATLLLACTFLVIKYFEYSAKFHHYVLTEPGGAQVHGHVTEWTQDTIVFQPDAGHGHGGGAEHAQPMRLSAEEVRQGKLRFGNLGPWHSNFYATYFTMTGLHGLHVLGGVVAFLFLLGPGARMWKTNPEKYTNRVECTGLYWHFVDLVWIFLFPSLYLL